MHWMIGPIRRYADLRGRSRRIELWMFVLFLFVAFFGTVALDTLLGTGGETVSSTATGPDLWSHQIVSQGGWITALFGLAMLVPLLAVMVRRLHDVGWSGLWLLAGFVPLLGSLFLLVLFLTDSQRGPNRFGADPRQAAA